MKIIYEEESDRDIANGIEPIEKRSHLLVVPASTLSNWQNELTRFCPNLNVFMYHGSQKERIDMQYSIKELITGDNPPDVILTTYTIFERSSTQSDRIFLYKQHFNYLICDEGHCIKNSSTSRFIYLNRVKSNHRLVLSGTPVQNNILELLSLLSFLMKKLLNKTKCEILLKALELEKTNHSNDTNGLNISQLRSMLAPFVLRRIKKDVLSQLTEKIIVVKKLPMTNFQKDIYRDMLLKHAKHRETVQNNLLLEKSTDKKLNCKTTKKKTPVTNENVINVTPTDINETTLKNKKEVKSTFKTTKALGISYTLLF